jgi:proteasome lid subunit RPN8/RPN11
MMETFITHALNEYPKEAVALVYDNKINIVENVHKNPTKHFRVKPRDVLEALMSSTGLVEIIHSHPEGFPNLSESDLACAERMQTKVSVIVTDGTKVIGEVDE